MGRIGNYIEKFLSFKFSNICQKENADRSFIQFFLQNIITDGLKQKLVFQYLKKNHTQDIFHATLDLFNNNQVDIDWLIKNIKN